MEAPFPSETSVDFQRNERRNTIHVNSSYLFTYQAIIKSRIILATDSVVK
jgi:hypothetical protein